ncbi:MAG TPA: hypothetical protein VE999_17845 [Gemmataceae bacterium]|nr:hypothetical protein [Gemmataceae bacterium]
MTVRRTTLGTLYALGVITHGMQVRILPLWLNQGTSDSDPRIWASITITDDGSIRLRWRADGRLHSANEICTQLETTGVITWRCRTFELWAIDGMTISMFRLASLLHRATRSEQQRA